MHDQMRCMIGEAYALFIGLRRAHAVREHDVAEQHLAVVAVLGHCIEQVGLDHRKGEDVGRPVLAAILRVELSDFFVRGQADRDLDRGRRRGEVAMRCRRDRRTRRTGGERLPVAVRPFLPTRQLDVDHASPS